MYAITIARMHIRDIFLFVCGLLITLVVVVSFTQLSPAWWVSVLLVIGQLWALYLIISPFVALLRR